MSDYRFKVNLSGMIEILSDHLYSSPDVYIRELLQNAVDAVVARKKNSSPEDLAGYEGNIDVYLEDNTLRFIDNGIGLTDEEIHKFLSIIGESSKKQLDEAALRSDYIGKFGIGLLSCFMVSNEIVVKTRSVRSEDSFIWIGKPDGTYTLEKYNEPHDVGTEIILTPKTECLAYFEPERVKGLLLHYGQILPYPVILHAAIAPWGNVRQIGEDICAGEMLLTSNVRIEPAAMGAMLAAGVQQVAVIAKPRVGVIPTGDEVVAPSANPKPGDVMEFNSTIFSGMVRQWGADPIAYPIVPDKPDLVRDAVAKAVAECDIVLLNAGSSAGRDDYSSRAVAAVGEVLYHGIAMKPGKPALVKASDKRPAITNVPSVEEAFAGIGE